MMPFWSSRREEASLARAETETSLLTTFKSSAKLSAISSFFDSNVARSIFISSSSFTSNTTGVVVTGSSCPTNDPPLL
ncbi:MAG: hypothetical protein RL104_583 [Bacteroidota bacterium]